MHILLIPSWYKSPEFPTMGSFFEEQARALMKAGHQVSIFYPNFYPLASFFKKKVRFGDEWNDNGLMSYIYAVQSVFPRSRRVNNIYLLLRSNHEFKKYVKKRGRPDVIHAHSVFDAGIIGLYLSEKYNIPMALTEHLTHFTGTLKGDAYKMKLAAGIFRKASASIAVSHHFKKDLERELGLEGSVFRVVYNMVGDQFYTKFEKKLHQPGEPFHFFTNSFLNDRKNHTLLFDALGLLIQKNHNVDLRVGGSGETEEKLKKYVRDRGLEKHVTFLGGLSREQVKSELDRCHAFILGSRFESFGVVLIESLASGRPVVSTNSGGPEEIVDPSNGLLVNSFDPADFSAAMENLMVRYASYDQGCIRENCHKRFSEETITRELMNVYVEVIGKFSASKSRMKKIPLFFSSYIAMCHWLFFPE